MRLSNETPRSRWVIIAVVLGLVSLLATLHVLGVRDYLGMSGRTGLRGEAASSIRPLFLGMDADAQVWLRHAKALSAGHELRLRHTMIDNAPDGREVHWNSAWAWTILGFGHARARMMAEPLPLAIDRGALWLNLPVFLALVLALSTWTASRAGSAAGGIVALGMLGSNRFYEGFYPSYVDHHGLLSASILGMMLGMVFMGGGWWRPPGKGPSLLPSSTRAVRWAAVVSAIAGAIGVWLSAASLLPPIAFIGAAGVATVFIVGRAQIAQGATFDGFAWRLWGRVGAGLSFLFYLAEYAPSHLGMRMEVNHPLHALAWLGGGELVAECGERWLSGATAATWLRKPQRLVMPLLAMAAAPVAIVVGGASVFSLADPFATFVFRGIVEVASIVTRVKIGGWPMLAIIDVQAFALIVAIALCFRRGAGDRSLLVFTTLATLGFTAMGCWQTRWLLSASGPQICLVLVVVAVVAAGRSASTIWWITLAAIGVLYLPPAVNRIREVKEQVRRHDIQRDDAVQALFRDVALELRKSRPQGDIVVLASPNSSVSLGFYGDFQTIGTLCWEDIPGLKTAAEIYSTHSDEEAADLIRAHRITHIAMISENDFLMAYYGSIHGRSTLEEFKQSLGYRLFKREHLPPWVHELPYEVPQDLLPLHINAVLYSVNFGEDAQGEASPH